MSLEDNGGELVVDVDEDPQTKVPVRLREPCEIDSNEVMAVHHAFGFRSQKRNNVFILDERFVLTSIGAAAAIIGTELGDVEYIFCPDDQGVGCLCVHPSRKYFAVGGKGNRPNVYIYTYPEKKLCKVLRNGTERSFASMSFSAEGSKLATVGGTPDFMLTIWNWEGEQIILRNKAFAQEVYNVSFNPNHDGLLTTSGLGHIRFWKMASTFTGLKLQGDIGKFGKVELSDVAAYADMPDGKVLSGSESGSLLLWDGNFIKLEVRRTGDLLPHNGEINVCLLLKADRPSIAEFLTAGKDGWLRWWSMEKIDQAEIDDENPFFVLDPTREVHLEGVVPMAIRIGDGFIIVQDQLGAIWKLDDPVLPGSTRTIVWSGHAGKVAGLATSHVDHFAATTGVDKTVRLWNYVSKNEVYKSTFSSGGSCIIWAPRKIDSKGRTVLVGFDDGVVRVMARAITGWKLVNVFKPHNCMVTSVRFSPDCQNLVTTGEDGTIFLFAVLPAGENTMMYQPKGFVTIPSKANKVIWTSTSDKILVASNAGKVFEITIPHNSNDIKYSDTKESFELRGLPMRTYTFKRKPLKRKITDAETAPAPEGDEKEEFEEKQRKLREEEDAKWLAEQDRVAALPLGNVLSIMLLETSPNRFVIGLDGNDAGPLFVCSFESEFPHEKLANIPIEDGLNSEEPDPNAYVAGTKGFSACSFLEPSWSRRLYINGGLDGSVRIRPVESAQCYAFSCTHDGVLGVVSGACTSFDDSFLLTAGGDGTIFVHRLKPGALVESCSSLSKKAGARIKARKVRLDLFGALGGVNAASSPQGSPKSPTRSPDLAKVELGSAVSEFRRGIPRVLALADSTKEGYDEVAVNSTTLTYDEGFESSIQTATDITDSAAYSIQDDKLKTGEDTKRQLAEIEKNKVRKVIEQLRADFERLLKENENEMEETKLIRSEFDIDAELLESLHLEGKMQMEEVVKETQWDVNRSKVRLNKLKRHFLDPLLVESIALHGFNGSHSVESFRTSRFSETLNSAIAAIRELLDESDQHINGDGELSGKPTASGTSGDMKTTDSGRGPGHQTRQSGRGKQETGWEARKAGRKERKAQMQELLDQKPDENADDPADIAAINWVMNNMGDYKLKSAQDYQVPAHLQVNSEKKKRQCILLAESIRAIRMSFNEKFLALRELKKRIVESARTDAKRIQNINRELSEPNDDLSGLPLVLSDAEWPEKRLEFSKEEFDEFLQGQEGDAVERVKALQASGRHEEKVGSKESGPVETVSSQVSLHEKGIPVMEFQEVEKKGILSKKGTNRFETEERETRKRLLLHEKSVLFERNIASIKAFDSAVYDLRKERSQLHADLAAAELRQILLFRELVLLNDFEKKDVSLNKKLESCRSQKAEVVAEITLCQEKLSAKKAEIEVWQEKDRIIMDEFNVIVGGDSNPLNAQLLKIFKRKIKRSKQKGEDGSDEEDSESEDDDDYDDEEEEMEDGEPEEERCPDGCDPTTYGKVLELREKRLDQEEILNDFNKSVDELKKANDRHQGREKQIDKDLKATIVEIQAFQNEKQRKLNEIEASVVMKLEQISCLVEPEDGGELESKDDDEFDEDTFEEHHEIDEESPEVELQKEELADLLSQLERVEELPEDEIFMRQQELIAQIHAAKRNIWESRILATKLKAWKAKLLLPKSIEGSLIFDRDELFELHAGIGKLIEENKSKKKEYKDLHHTQKRLVREKRQKEADIMVLRDKCDDLQMLKFGQIIDIDAIEKMGTSKAVTDLKLKFLEQEKLQRAELSTVKETIDNAQLELLSVTKVNSKLLQEIAHLTEVQRKLEGELSTSGSSSNRDHAMQSHKERQETTRLTQLIKVQNKEIEALKREISMLRGSNPRSNQNQILD